MQGFAGDILVPIPPGNIRHTQGQAFPAEKGGVNGNCPMLDVWD